MKLLLYLFSSLALSISSFSQNGVYLYGLMENAPATPVPINVSIYADSSITQAMLFTEPSGNIPTQWVDLPSGVVIQSLVAGLTDCQVNYTFQSWNGSEFDGLIDISLNFNYYGDSTIFGCTDPTALNYNSQATHDDGSCQYDTFCDLNEVTVIINTQSSGKEISWSLAHNSAIVADGANYRSNNTYSSNWCLESGCYTFEMFDLFDDGWNGSTFQILLDGAIIQTGTLLSGNHGTVSFGINQEGCVDTPLVYGCSDPEAVNYNPEATTDDGSCRYEIVCDLNEIEIVISPESWAHQIEWQLLTADSIYVAGGTGYSNNMDNASQWCLANGSYIFEMYDSIGDSLNGATVEVIFYGETLASGTLVGVQNVSVNFGLNQEGCESPVYGCTDPNAYNYNPDATVDDGSCNY